MEQKERERGIHYVVLLLFYLSLFFICSWKTCGGGVIINGDIIFSVDATRLKQIRCFLNLHQRYPGTHIVDCDTSKNQTLTCADNFLRPLTNQLLISPKMEETFPSSFLQKQIK